MLYGKPPAQVPITTSHHARRFALRGGALGAVVAAGLIVLSGCDPSPYAQRRLRMREERLNYTVQTWARSEEIRPGRLEHDIAFIPQDLELHAARLKRAGQWFVDWQKRDAERFRQRGPIYLDKTGKVMWGKPERIEDNAITLFF